MAPFTQRIPKKLALELLQMKSILLKRNILFITIALALSANINAQQNDTGVEEVRTLEEVIITAQKREQTLQEVPVSVTAFSGTALVEQGAVDVRDITGQTPGLNIGGSNTEATVFIRGVGSVAPGIGADPAVGIYVDGAPASRGTNATSAFFDVERIEVVKGPQGTLFGRNASAGAISIITNKPDLNENYGHVMLGIGDVGQRRGQFVGNWSASDQWAVRIGVNHDQRDGLYYNSAADEELLNRKSTAVRFSVLGLLTDNWETTLMVEGLDFSAYDAIVTDADAFAPVIAQDPRPRKEGLESSRAIWTNKWDLSNDKTLTSITSYYDHDVWVQPVDADEIDFPLATFIEPQTNTTFTQELRLNGSSEKVDWFVGASYLKEDLAFDTDLNYEEGIILDLLLDAGDLCLDPELPECTYRSETPFGKNKTTSYAIYGDLTWAVSDAVSLTAGARYTKDKKDMYFSNPPNGGILGLFGEQLTGLVTDGKVYSDDSWSSFDPRLALNWDLSDNTTFFASVAQGYKSGGINRQADVPLPDTQSLKTFDEETVRAFEAGTKSRLLDGRATLNVSAFFNDYDNFQLETLVDLLPEVLNVGDLETKGIEMEGRVLATDRLELAATYAYLDAKVKRSLEPAIVGNRAPLSPKHSGSASAHYTIDTDRGEWKLSGIWTYSDSYWFDIFNTLEQKSFSLINLRAGYQAASGNWGIAGFVDNATDKEYFAGRFAFLDIANRRAPGRLYRVEFTYNF
jgi:iron complex outermembrane receptor protein